MAGVGEGWAYLLMTGGFSAYFYAFAIHAYRSGKRLVAGASASWATMAAVLAFKMAMIPGFL